MPHAELASALAHVDRVQQALSDAFGPLHDGEWRLLRAALQAHLEQRRLSLTALADVASARSSGRRSVLALVERGLLEFQPASASGQRLHVFPSQRMLDATGRLSVQVHNIGAAFVAPQPAGGDQPIGWPQASQRGFARSQTLELVAYSDPVFDIIKHHRHEIELFLGAPLRVASYPQAQYRAVLEQTLRGRSGGAQLVALPLPWLSACRRQGLLRPLERELAHSDAIAAEAFYDQVWHAGRDAGRQYAIALQPAVEFLWYRQDLLEAHGIEPPRSFAELQHAARILHAPKRGRWGIAWNGAAGVALAETFLQLLAAHGSNWRPSRDPLPRPLATAAIEHLRALLPCSPPNLEKLDWERSARLFGRGEAAFCYGWSNRHGWLASPELVRDGAKVGVVEHPTLDGAPGHTPLGGALLAIPARLATAQARLAWRAIETLASPELGKYFVLHGASGHGRYALARDRYVLQRHPLIGRIDTLARHGRLIQAPGHGEADYPGLCAILSRHLSQLLRAEPAQLAAGLATLETALRGKLPATVQDQPA